jgi:hypothetical protein
MSDADVVALGQAWLGLATTTRRGTTAHRKAPENARSSA